MYILFHIAHLLTVPLSVKIDLYVVSENIVRGLPLIRYAHRGRGFETSSTFLLRIRTCLQEATVKERGVEVSSEPLKCVCDN